MTVNELAEKINGKLILGCGENEISCGLVCDLLSFVMANGSEGCAWVTVQTHMNVVAVASLHDMAAIIWPAGVEADAESAKKAEENGIAVITSPLPAYEICGLMFACGIGA